MLSGIAPAPASQSIRLCRQCHLPLTLDQDIARASLAAGWPAVEVLRCVHGHSARADAPSLREGPVAPAPAKSCPVCGLPVTRQHGTARKYCGPRCAAFVAGEQARAFNRGEEFVLEAQTWFRGPARAGRPTAPATPLPPLDPLAGRMPRVWGEGWLCSYGVATREPAA